MKDPRLAKMMNPKAMPFDGKRMIYGGFEFLVGARRHSRRGSTRPNTSSHKWTTCAGDHAPRRVLALSWITMFTMGPRQRKPRECLRMSLTLYFHPLSSFCQKALIALYENDTPFEPHIVDSGDEASSAEFKRLWPIGKFPVLRDERATGRSRSRASSSSTWRSTIRAGRWLVPPTADVARQTRLRDRFYDLYVHVPMQKVVADRLRPAGKNDPFGVEQAKALLTTAYGMIEQEMATKTWAMGEAFSMADCAAAPALFYADKVMPFGGDPQERGGLSRPADATPVLRPCGRGSAAYFALFPKYARRL